MYNDGNLSNKYVNHAEEIETETQPNLVAMQNASNLKVKVEVNEESYNGWLLYVKGARVTYAVSALPFTTKLQVKPGRTGSVAGWVTIWVQPRVDSQTWDLCE